MSSSPVVTRDGEAPKPVVVVNVTVESVLSDQFVMDVMSPRRSKRAETWSKIENEFKHLPSSEGGSPFPRLIAVNWKDCYRLGIGRCEGRLTVDRESFRNHTMAKIAGQLNGGKENMCKADVWKGLGDRLAMRLPLSKPREIDKSSLETYNRSSISSEFNFEIDLPGKRDRRTIYRLNVIKLYRRKPELANLVMENSSEGIVNDSEILYSEEWFPPDPGTISVRQKDLNLLTRKPFRIKTCCTSQMLINSLREDTEYILDLGENKMGQTNRTLPVVWLGRKNRYPYLRIK
ncbi:uncharacterized protein TNCV_3000991 [Trichonephila clavipes]|nr:uncharacterized protein TNCV_3000991 [Trichonephila clavipes]